MKVSASLIFALIFSAITLSAQKFDRLESVITVGESVHTTLPATGIHTFTIVLEPDYFVHGFVNQESVDVVVTIYNPEGEKAAEFDGPAIGKEFFQFTTKAGGVYRIEVRPFEEDEGDYSIMVSIAEPVATDPAARLNQLMIEYTGDDVPGAAVLVIKNGKPVFRNYWGMANLAYGIPMSDTTLHNIGSTSKQFLTFALLLLQEEGKLSLDVDVREYIPELPDFGHTVTLRHLVNHTSGYREFINLIAMTGRNVSTELGIEKIIGIVQRQPELQNEPGSEFNYNNTGYALMTEVIKRVTGTPFPEWMKENVFDPLEMHHTVVRTSPNQIVPNRSVGYSPGREGRFTEATDLGGAAGAGGIHTTMGDLAKWVSNLINPVVGTAAMIEEMSTPFELNDGTFTQYGLGLFVQEFKGLPYFHHGGADIAHRSMLMVFPGIDAAVVTQSNLATFNGALTNRIAELFLQEYLETVETVQELDEEADKAGNEAEFEYEIEKFDHLAGRYELAIMPGFILTFSRDGDRIYTQATNQPEVNLMAMSDSTFSLAGVDAFITFHLNEDATADSLTLHQNGNHIARKIAFTLDLDQMAEYTGRYFSDEIETLYTVVMKEDTLVLRHYQMYDDLELTPTTEDTFGSGFPISSVRFVRDENGQITGFKASNGRTRDVLFGKRD
ncbi:MAG: serine hydrolase [Balneolaceae bacterium]|nr:MAG: serine hydrolase [Balneolaceae bacterium]